MTLHMRLLARGERTGRNRGCLGIGQNWSDQQRYFKAMRISPGFDGACLVISPCVSCLTCSFNTVSSCFFLDPFPSLFIDPSLPCYYPYQKVSSSTLVQPNPIHFRQYARLHSHCRPLGPSRCSERHHHQRRLEHQLRSRLDVVGRILHCSM